MEEGIRLCKSDITCLGTSTLSLDGSSPMVQDMVVIHGISVYWSAHIYDAKLKPWKRESSSGSLISIDLETPLEIPAEAQLEQFAPHTLPTPYNSGENLGDVVHGGNSLCTAQHLSPLNQSTASLEGSFWQGKNITNMLQQENGIVGIASQGYSSASNHPDLASTRQPKGSRNIAAQAQIRDISWRAGF